jgi:hypothetical protein
VRTRAYFLWEEAGRPDGRSDEFWATAERDLAGPPIMFFPDSVEWPPPLTGILGAMSNPELPPEGLPEWASFTPGWTVRHERPGDSMPAVVRFGDDLPRRVPATTGSTPAFVNGYFTAAQIAMDPAQAGRPDRTVESEWEANPEGGPILRNIRYVESNAPEPAETATDAHATEHEVNERLMRLREACERDSEKLKEMLAKRREKRSRQAQSAVIDAPTSPAWQRARELVDPPHWDEFYQFIQGLTVSQAFTKYLNTSPRAKEAVAGIFDEAAASLQSAIKQCVGHATERPSSWIKRLLRWIANRRKTAT